VITFTRTTPGTHDPTTGAWSDPTVTTITGSAIQVRGDPRRYQALELVLSTMPTLLFGPTDYGLRAGTAEFVQPGDTTVWGTKIYTVRDVDPIAPDGVVIAARIVIAA
jgi:hypothetical protein